MKSWKFLLVVVCALLVFGVLSSHPKATGEAEQMATVKLYSGGVLIATWENARPGYLEGTSYVFRVGAQNREVRISGTYSVEVVR